MARLPIRWMEARAFCQATEEEDRVRQAMDAAFPSKEEAREVLEGQFGNPLVALTRRIDRSQDLRSVWNRWREAGLLGALQRELEARVDDDGIFHFRIDKQAAFEGRLAPAMGADPIDIHVKLEAYPAKREEILRVARELVAGAA